MVTGSDLYSGDWAALPVDLLACIRIRLPVADFVRFAAVCTAWRRTFPSATPAPQLPWLLLPPSPTSSSSSSSPGDAGITCRFFSPSEERTYHAPVPELRGTRCVGSCDGWVASFDSAAAELSLVNPLTRARLPLPSPLPSMPCLETVRDGEGRIVQYGLDAHRWSTVYKADDLLLAKKVVMSSNPTDATACQLAATFQLFRRPLLLAVGEENWAEKGRTRGLRDIAYHGGEDRFYGLRCDDSVYRWRADDVETFELYCRRGREFPRSLTHYSKHLAWHPPSGDLLLILVHKLVMLSLLISLEPGVQEMRAVEAFGGKFPEESQVHPSARR